MSGVEACLLHPFVCAKEDPPVVGVWTSLTASARRAVGPQRSRSRIRGSPSIGESGGEGVISGVSVVWCVCVCAVVAASDHVE